MNVLKDKQEWSSMRVLVSLKKARIFIDALTQVDVIGLLVGTTGLAEMNRQIELGRVKLRFGKSSASKIPIQVKYKILPNCRRPTQYGGLSTSG